MKDMYPSSIKALNDNICEEKHKFRVSNSYIVFSFLVSYFKYRTLDVLKTLMQYSMILAVNFNAHVIWYYGLISKY